MQKLATALMFVTSVIGAATLHAEEWRREVVDPYASGKFSSLRIDNDGNAHVSYMDESRNQLKYGFWDHKVQKWFTTMLDSSRGFCSLALDSKQHPHISYLAYGDGQLNHVSWSGSAWDKQPIRIKAKDISFYTSITIDPKDNPRISYYEYWGTGEDYLLHLRNVAWNGKFWEVGTIDSTPGSGKFNSNATDSAGNPHVAYANVKAENASLRYAKWNGRSWDIEVLEGAAAPFYVYSVTLVLDKDDIPHITYTDVTNRLVKYAVKRNGGWQIQTVAALMEVAYPDRNGLAIDPKGQPYISYYDAGSGLLKLAHRLDQKWLSTIVDENFAGFTSSLQIDHDVIWLTYADETGGGLKCARGPLDQRQQSRGGAAR